MKVVTVCKSKKTGKIRAFARKDQSVPDDCFVLFARGFKTDAEVRSYLFKIHYAVKHGACYELLLAM